MKYRYTYELNPEPEGGFSISFPNVYGANSQAETVAEAAVMGADCLSTAIEGYITLNHDIPKPDDVKSGQHFAELSLADAAKVARYEPRRAQSGSKSKGKPNNE